jgi:hypothetical protein
MPVSRTATVTPAPPSPRSHAAGAPTCGTLSSSSGSRGFGGSGTNAKITAGGREIRCLKLDTFTRDLDRIDLLKIDVEGYTDLVLSGAQEALKRTRRAIIEFSIGDVKMRKLETSVDEHFADLLGTMAAFDHVYYISRRDGLVSLDRAEDLVALLSVEHGVGDLLFSRAQEPSITTLAFTMRKVSELMVQNHLCKVEIQRLKDRPPTASLVEIGKRSWLRLRNLRAS